MLCGEGVGGSDTAAGVTEDLTRDVGTTLYAAPEQLDNVEHSKKVFIHLVITGSLYLSLTPKFKT